MIGMLSCFTLLTLFGGLQAWMQNPFTHCGEFTQCGEGVAIGGLPTGEELKNYFCPNALQLGPCVFNQVEKCTDKKMSELTSSNNQSVAVYSSFAVSLNDIVVDICNEESTLHASYVESVECLSENLEIIRHCLLDVEQVYNHYKILATQDSNLSEADEKRCLQHAFIMACITGHAAESCGNVAKSVIIEILSRLHLMALDECPALIVPVLKNEFLNSLGLNPLLKSTYSEVFDVLTG